MKKGIFVIPLIVSAACVGGVLAFSPSASAAIDGENGPIVYIDNQVPTENENGNNEDRAVIRQEDTVSQVITTAPDGSNQQVVAEEKDSITAAGISAPNSEGNYDIAYGVEATSGCEMYEKTCAVVNKVTTAGDGSVVEGQDTLARLDSLVNGSKKYPSESWVTNLSYSPDGQTVLATYSSDKRMSMTHSSVVTIDNTDGTVTPLVDAKADPYLNAGYADNGDIYFSQMKCSLDDIVCRWNNRSNLTSDIWVIKAGETTPAQLTTTSRINEYFIDVSPDSKSVLVAQDSPACTYHLYVLGKRDGHPPVFCDYYLVDTTTGAATKIEDMPSYFVPAYFSPDGTSLIGTAWPTAHKKTEVARGLIENEAEVYTAVFNLSTKVLAKLTDQLGVIQWAPLAQADSTPEVPVVTVTATPTTVVSATLPNTGSSAVAYMALVIALAFASTATVIASAKSYKK
ncbi:hypothetical protein KBC51_01515 [Candidatus Saccharibacteria bacterium]|nr:hypothetical protein [Candidatus Saccharibacteria bacterium]